MDMQWEAAYILSNPLPLLLSARFTSLTYSSLFNIYALRISLTFSFSLFLSQITDLSFRPCPKSSPIHFVHSLIMFLDFSSLLPSTFHAFLYVFQTLLYIFALFSLLYQL